MWFRKHFSTTNVYENLLMMMHQNDCKIWTMAWNIEVNIDYD